MCLNINFGGFYFQFLQSVYISNYTDDTVICTQQYYITFHC